MANSPATPSASTPEPKAWLQYNGVIPGVRETATWSSSLKRVIINNLEFLGVQNTELLARTAAIEAQNARIISLLEAQSAGDDHNKGGDREGRGERGRKEVQDVRVQGSQQAPLRGALTSCPVPVKCEVEEHSVMSEEEVRADVMGLMGDLLAGLHKSWFQKYKKHVYLSPSAECQADAAEFLAWVHAFLKKTCGEDEDLKDTLDRLSYDSWIRVYIEICHKHPDIFDLLAWEQQQMAGRAGPARSRAGGPVYHIAMR